MLAVLAVLAFCGWALLAAAVIALAAALASSSPSRYAGMISDVTTTMRLILGLDYPSAGSVTVNSGLRGTPPRAARALAVISPLSRHCWRTRWGLSAGF